jgi:DNA-binding transcriptional regulator YiaG
MPNVVSILKDEITRVARKSVRLETETLKKSSSQYRAQIADLKRRVQSLERHLGRLSKGSGKVSSSEEVEHDTERGFRFRAKGFAAHRQRLGLSAAQTAALLGVSGQTIYHWEQGKSKPRPNQMPRIDALRKLSKTQAAAAVHQVMS